MGQELRVAGSVQHGRIDDLDGTEERDGAIGTSMPAP
jgi:hypothetical protein